MRFFAILFTCTYKYNSACLINFFSYSVKNILDKTSCSWTNNSQ
ncbi:hypothetical protein [Spiroplasma endosymbiont of Asaphidion curtum]